MTAFEELGVMPELGMAADEMGWLLPTDIQAESIPLILGGGDVLMAAETGSGKTGAFSIPVIQIVHESKTETNVKKGGNIGGGGSSNSWQMSMFDRGSAFAVGPDGLLCQSRHFKEWHGSRSSLGITHGKYYYEALCKDGGLCRVGWSTCMADLNLGTDKQGFGFGGTGKKSYNKQFDTYGEPFTMHDTIGCYLNMDDGTISFSKNGKDLGQAFIIPPPLMGIPIFVAVVLKNAEIQLNFGNTTFKFPPASPYKALCQANNSHIAHNSNENTTKSSKPTQKAANAPYAVIIEPSRELAEQTYNNVKVFSKHVGHPGISAVCVIGGVSAADQLREIEQGVDILIGTPGRVDDFISTRKVNLNQVRFLVLDECDGLLSGGNTDFIKRMYAGMSQVTNDGKRLQVIVCSATLHNFDVKKLAEKIMHFPTWVDLKGEDAVPETVHHVVVPVQPTRDLTWQGLRKHIATDGVHQRDNLSYSSDEKMSEAIKKLKGEYIVQVIRKHDMDKSIIFCRTKLDCDNLENYFTTLGGGPRNKGHLFSCVCLHSDRKPGERKANLENFKRSEVRHLICTDVAARGIDIRGVPFVINVTLPDEKQNYVHRIGRVGRAERMGLAISLVATEQREKVWYHSNCGTRGRGCYNTDLTDHGGCCIWYDEQILLGDIEQHLKITIEQISLNMDIPVNEFDGKVVYGKKSTTGRKGLYKGHAGDLAPAVQELQALEKSAQLSFLMLSNKTKQALGGKA